MVRQFGLYYILCELYCGFESMDTLHQQAGMVMHRWCTVASGGEGKEGSMQCRCNVVASEGGANLNLWKEPQCLPFVINFDAPPPCEGWQVKISSTIFSFPLSMMRRLMSAQWLCDAGWLCNVSNPRAKESRSCTRRTAKARRRAGKVVEIYVDQIHGMIFGVCGLDPGYDLCAHQRYRYRYMQIGYRVWNSVADNRIEGMFSF